VSAPDEEGFGREPDLALGVEEELLLVDAETLALAPDSARVLARIDVPAGTAQHDLYAALVEITSPPSRTVGEAVDALRALRRAVRAAGGVPVGVGVHPTGRFGDAPHVDLPRYVAVAQAMRGLMRRTPEAALHVHVGVPDRDAAIRVLNALREALPLLQALAAGSPFWFGVDSGLASARTALIREYPSVAVPRPFASFDEWAGVADAALRASALEDRTLLWWDVRLQPRLGTVELRSLDAQSSLSAVAALAALAQGVAADALERPVDAPTPQEALVESSFRAARDGVAATLWHDGRLRPVAEIAVATAERVRPHLRALGGADALAELPRMLEDGGRAARQRRLAAGSFDVLLRALVEETAAA
jgi:carboxylate-amine ligase